MKLSCRSFRSDLRRKSCDHPRRFCWIFFLFQLPNLQSLFISFLERLSLPQNDPSLLQCLSVIYRARLFSPLALQKSIVSSSSLFCLTSLKANLLAEYRLPRDFVTPTSPLSSPWCRRLRLRAKMLTDVCGNTRALAKLSLTPALWDTEALVRLAIHGTRTPTYVLLDCLTVNEFFLSVFSAILLVVFLSFAITLVS